MGVVVRRRSAVPSEAEVGGVGGGRLGRLRGLGDGRERLDVGRRPAEESPRDHGRRPEQSLARVAWKSVAYACGGGERFEWRATRLGGDWVWEGKEGAGEAVAVLS